MVAIAGVVLKQESLILFLCGTGRPTTESARAAKRLHSKLDDTYTYYIFERCVRILT